MAFATSNGMTAHPTTVLDYAPAREEKDRLLQIIAAVASVVFIVISATAKVYRQTAEPCSIEITMTDGSELADKNSPVLTGEAAPESWGFKISIVAGAVLMADEYAVAGDAETTAVAGSVEIAVLPVACRFVLYGWNGDHPVQDARRQKTTISSCLIRPATPESCDTNMLGYHSKRGF